MENTPNEIRDMVVYLRKADKQINYIAKFLEISVSSVNKILRETGLNTAVKEQKAMRDTIISLAGTGKTQREISKLLGVDEHTVGRTFKSKGLNKTAQVNQDRFNEDDEFTCYYIGLFLADGNMGKRKNRVTYRGSIMSTDLDVIEPLGKELNSHIVKRQSTRYGVKGEIGYSVYFSSNLVY